MAKYNVKIPFAGILYFNDVEADSPEAAIDAALAMDESAASDKEEEVFQKLHEGNVSNAPLDEAEAEEVDEEEEN